MGIETPTPDLRIFGVNDPEDDNEPESPLGQRSYDLKKELEKENLEVGKINVLPGERINVLRSASEGKKGKMEFDWTFDGYEEKNPEKKGWIKVSKMTTDETGEKLFSANKTINPTDFKKYQELNRSIDFKIDLREVQKEMDTLRKKIETILSSAKIGQEMFEKNDVEIAKIKARLDKLQELLITPY